MRTLRLTLAALATGLMLALAAPSISPALAQQPTSVNPTASSVKEADLLNALKGDSTLAGRVTIPDQKSANLIQPQGQTWRDFHRTTLVPVGGAVILGMLILLVGFYLVRGKIMIDAGPSAQKILRFNTLERFIHWMTASCFIILGLSGLNVTFGKYLLLPLIGPENFTAVSVLAKLAHNYLAWPFMLGLIFMFLVWVKENIPNSVDIEWAKQGGGLLTKGSHPPAKKFNAGQKVIFWSVILGGAALSVSGVNLLFPATSNVLMLQFWNVVHALVGVVLVAIMIAHIYIGSVGMEGAYDAMGSGEVDLNWAKEHHSLWVKEVQSKPGAAPGAAGVPAE